MNKLNKNSPCWEDRHCHQQQQREQTATPKDSAQLHSEPWALADVAAAADEENWSMPAAAAAAVVDAVVVAGLQK